MKYAAVIAVGALAYTANARVARPFPGQAGAAQPGGPILPEAKRSMPIEVDPEPIALPDLHIGTTVKTSPILPKSKRNIDWSGTWQGAKHQGAKRDTNWANVASSTVNDAERLGEWAVSEVKRGVDWEGVWKGAQAQGHAKRDALQTVENVGKWIWNENAAAGDAILNSFKRSAPVQWSGTWQGMSAHGPAKRDALSTVENVGKDLWNANAALGDEILSLKRAAGPVDWSGFWSGANAPEHPVKRDALSTVESVGKDLWNANAALGDEILNLKTRDALSTVENVGKDLWNANAALGDEILSLKTRDALSTVENVGKDLWNANAALGDEILSLKRDAATGPHITFGAGIPHGPGPVIINA